MPFAQCLVATAGDSRWHACVSHLTAPVSVPTYPRLHEDRITNKEDHVLLQRCDCPTTTTQTMEAVDVSALLVPAMANGGFHALLEWGFHTFATIQAAHEAGREALTLLFFRPAKRWRYPPPTSSMEQQPWGLERRLLESLVRLAGGGARYLPNAWEPHAATLALSTPTWIGLMPELSLAFSSCIPLSAFPRPAKCAGSGGKVPEWLSDRFVASLSARTDCAATRRRLAQYRAFVRPVYTGDNASLEVSPREEPRPSVTTTTSADADDMRILLIQRGAADLTAKTTTTAAGPARTATRRLAHVDAFAGELTRRLRERLTRACPNGLGKGGGRRSPRVAVTVTDFTANTTRNARLLAETTAVVAIHGQALSNLVLAAPGSLIAAVQLLPACLTDRGSISAFHTLAQLTARHGATVCCACECDAAAGVALAKAGDVCEPLPNATQQRMTTQHDATAGDARGIVPQRVYVGRGSSGRSRSSSAPRDEAGQQHPQHAALVVCDASDVADVLAEARLKSVCT